MSDYNELVNDLRYCASTEQACDECKHNDELVCVVTLLKKAADAVEELTAYVRQIEELRRDGYYLQKTKMMTYGQATMTMPLPEPPKEET